MFEYLVMAFCFLVLFLIKGFLVKKTFNRKMNFYSDPVALAKEIKGHKNSADFQFHDDSILKKFIEFNLNMYRQTSNIPLLT